MAVPSLIAARRKIRIVIVRIMAIGMMNAFIKKINIDWFCRDLVGKSFVFGSLFSSECCVMSNAMRFDEINVVENGALIKGVLVLTNNTCRYKSFLSICFNCMDASFVFVVCFSGL